MIAIALLLERVRTHEDMMTSAMIDLCLVCGFSKCVKKKFRDAFRFEMSHNPSLLRNPLFLKRGIKKK